MRRSIRLIATMVATLIGATVVASPAFAIVPPAKKPPVVKPAPAQQDPYRAGQPITVNTDVLSSSGMAAWAIDQYLADHTKLPPLGAAFIQAERDHGVNAIVLVGLAMHESAGAPPTSHASRRTFGYNALDRDPFMGDRLARTPRGRRRRGLHHDGYLVPGASGRLPDARSMSLAYASSPHWQYGVVGHAIASSPKCPPLAMRKLRPAR
jgi:hypothetical protein